MKTDIKRREFILKSCQAGLAGCMLLYGSGLRAFGSSGYKPGEVPDPRKLNYCGYTCPPDCKMKRATLENNITLKKEAYTDWRIEQKYGLPFDADSVFCHGCKTPDKPLGLVVERCSVRNCALEKGYECCIQCDVLPVCDKEIWKTFPDFHKQVIEMQKIFLA